ncbi:MAG: Re/Si-specific NAD(P)(+) transhydrogenase subunit alpha [Halodesulfurarchaeum sp.]
MSVIDIWEETMIVGVPEEIAENETRVALVPSGAEKLADRGHEVVVESGAGSNAGYSDQEYRNAGCSIAPDRETVFDRAEILLQVRGLGANPERTSDPYTEGQIVIGLLGPYRADASLDDLAKKDVSAFSLELVPRISRAQQMDAQSSQANIGGYKAAILGAEQLPKLFPLMMTAAGTVQPADVFVVGAGVAGLQAIATADRLGATVTSYDIRPEVKEEVESVGAEFVELDLETEDSADEEGHARKMDEEFYRKQREMMQRVVADSDVVITTAAVPGETAPELVTESMVEGMDAGSVIVDLAAESGGNCEVTEPDETVEYEDVTVLGPTNLPATVPRHASELYDTNVRNFLDLLLTDGEIDVDTEDEIVDATLLTHDGVRRDPHLEEETEEEEDTE